MWNWMKKQYKKYEEMINYLFFGGLAFVFYMMVYWVSAKVIGADNAHPFLVIMATMIAWVLTAFFAYWTNHTFVFKSKVKDKGGIFKELFGFLGARLATLLLDMLVTWLMVRVFHIDHIITKVLSNILVMVCNYLFSKLFVFKKRQ